MTNILAGVFWLIGVIALLFGGFTVFYCISDAYQGGVVSRETWHYAAGLPLTGGFSIYLATRLGKLARYEDEYD